MIDIEAKLKICKEILQLDWEGVSRVQSYKRIARAMASVSAELNVFGENA